MPNISLTPELQTQFAAKLAQNAVPVARRSHYQRWLKSYWEACQRHHWQPEQPSSLGHWLQEIQKRYPSSFMQDQAREAVNLFYDWHREKASLVSQTAASATLQPSEHQSPANEDESAWHRIYLKLQSEIRVRHYSPKTLKNYTMWMRRFQAFTCNKHPSRLQREDVRDFLSELATRHKVAAATQNQALNALLFLFTKILKRELGELKTVVRAKRTDYIPVVLSRTEVHELFDQLEAPYDLIAKLLYGCGLRLDECLKLRIQDLNMDLGILTVHRGKGKKDRTLPLPQTLTQRLQEQFAYVKQQHRKDLSQGYDGVFLFDSIEQKYRNAPKELVWQWLFPAPCLSHVEATGENRRYHLHPSHVQKALKEAVRKAQIPKRVSPHSLRHSFATHLLQANYDICTIQTLMGHSDIRTTMIYLQTVKSQTLKTARSPLDFE